jgi:uncharacterized protein YkwD
MGANFECGWVASLVALAVGIAGCGGEGTTLYAADTGGTHQAGSAGMAGPGRSGAAGTATGVGVAGASGNGTTGGTEPETAGAGGADPGGAGPAGGTEVGAAGIAAGGAFGGGRLVGGAAGAGGSLLAAGAGGRVGSGVAGNGGNAGSDNYGDVPDTAACSTYREDDTWMSDWAAIEAEVVNLLNAERITGTDCPDGAGGTVVNESLPVVSMNPELRCAARGHSYDMATRDYYSNGTWDDTADPCNGVDDVCPTSGYICRQQISGVGPYRCLEGASLRIERAGYVHNGYFEGIGANHATASELVAAWMAHAALCPGLMNADFVDIGVGYTPGPGPGESRWTVILSASQ